MDDLNEVAIFARVVERKSFSAAARELHLSPSVVSKRVTALEDRIGAQLLNRSTRRLSLTEAGAQYYRRCARALTEIAAASGEVAGFSQALAGQLRVHSNLGIGIAGLAEGLIEFSRRYPALSIDLSMGAESINLLERGIDVVIRSADLKETSLDSRVLAPVAYHVCAAPAYLERAGRPRGPEDLPGHNCLIHTGQRNPSEWSFAGPEGAYTVRVSGNFSTNSGATLLHAALDGLGIVLLPDYTVWKALAEGRLVGLFEGQPTSDRCIRAFFPRSRYPQAKVTLFLDFLERFMAERPARSHGGGAAMQVARRR